MFYALSQSYKHFFEKWFKYLEAKNQNKTKQKQKQKQKKNKQTNKTNEQKTKTKQKMAKTIPQCPFHPLGTFFFSIGPYQANLIHIQLTTK